MDVDSQNEWISVMVFMIVVGVLSVGVTVNANVNVQVKVNVNVNEVMMTAEGDDGENPAENDDVDNGDGGDGVGDGNGVFWDECVGEDEAECDERECDEADEAECDGEGVVDSPDRVVLLVEDGLGVLGGGSRGRGGCPSAARIKKMAFSIRP